MPSALSAHTEPSHVDPVLIDVNFAHYVAQEFFELFSVPSRDGLDGSHMDVAVLPMCISAVSCIGPVLIVYDPPRDHVSFAFVGMISAPASSMQIE